MGKKTNKEIKIIGWDGSYGKHNGKHPQLHQPSGKGKTRMSPEPSGIRRAMKDYYNAVNGYGSMSSGMEWKTFLQEGSSFTDDFSPDVDLNKDNITNPAIRRAFWLAHASGNSDDFSDLDLNYDPRFVQNYQQAATRWRLNVADAESGNLETKEALPVLGLEIARTFHITSRKRLDEYKCLGFAHGYRPTEYEMYRIYSQLCIYTDHSRFCIGEQSKCTKLFAGYYQNPEFPVSDGEHRATEKTVWFSLIYPVKHDSPKAIRFYFEATFLPDPSVEYQCVSINERQYLTVDGRVFVSRDPVLRCWIDVYDCFILTYDYKKTSIPQLRVKSLSLCC